MKKTCTQCGVEQREMDFYRSGTGGFMSACKACHRAKVRANRLQNIDYYREYESGRANDPHRVQARLEYSKTARGRSAGNKAKRAYCERNPMKILATTAVGNAVRDGRLTKQPCEVCGEAKAQAHHDDYSKPLDVRWLCSKHHAEWHKHNTPLCPDQEQAA